MRIAQVAPLAESVPPKLYGRKVRGRFEQRFTAKRMAQDYLGHYKSLIAAKQ
jgi:hypothetical protein